ncbi:sigma-70 family RNA polymerase sigma factor [Arthrobacter sp. M4]|uniref:sigma-70 family RNA polymerase sigma factor n=1 Tax=Arthrobacter sp. M4 TaxID=218160 RepID=UPI001CDBBE28|nr:sigma-70 family RNA polymerase sigma factor [Arthrobacter sp. M4]MCA4135176.1 sigma-70 family RNA polymerase sigma factor [Arthrobacter sp. M4]
MLQDTRLSFTRHARPVERDSHYSSPVQGAIRRSLRDDLVMDHLDLAEAIALRYSSRTHDLADVRQVAYMGLVKAARGFDPAKGESFPAYAAPTISGEVKRYLRDHCWMVRPPRTVQDIRRRVLARREELAQALHRSPTDEELASDLDVESSQIREALAAGSSKRPDSIDAPGPDGSPGLAGTLAAAGSRTDHLEDVIALRNAIRSLSPEDRHVLYRRYYREETQQDIAEALGMSQMQVSRRLAKILVALQKQLLAEEPQRDSRETASRTS